MSAKHFYRAMQTYGLQRARTKTHSIKNALSAENVHSEAKDCKLVQSCIPSRMLRAIEKDCKLAQSCIPSRMPLSVENAHSEAKDCKLVQSCIPLGMLRSVENVRTSLFLHSVGMQPTNYK
jgi:hypothetical protein